MLPAKRAAAFIDFIVVLAVVVLGLLFMMVLFTSNVTGGGLPKSFNAITASPGCIPSVDLNDCGACGEGGDKCCYCPAKCVIADKTIKKDANCGGLAEEFAKVNTVFTCNDTCQDNYCQCPQGCILSQWATVKNGGDCDGFQPTSFSPTVLASCTQTCNDAICKCPTTKQRNGKGWDIDVPFSMCYKTIVYQGESCLNPPDLMIPYPGVQFSEGVTIKKIKVTNVGGADFIAPFRVCFIGPMAIEPMIIDGLEHGATTEVELESGLHFGSDEIVYAVANCKPDGSQETENEFYTLNNVYTCKTFQTAQGATTCTAA
jgi:hypothetical protein